MLSELTSLKWDKRIILVNYTTRANPYYTVFSSAKQIGAATQCLISGKDASDNNLDGGSNYKLTIPAKVPVKQF
jgi:hypothetical protein